MYILHVYQQIYLREKSMVPSLHCLSADIVTQIYINDYRSYRFISQPRTPELNEGN